MSVCVCVGLQWRLIILHFGVSIYMLQVALYTHTHTLTHPHLLLLLPSPDVVTDKYRGREQ